MRHIRLGEFRRHRLKGQHLSETLPDEVLNHVCPHAGVEPRVRRLPDAHAKAEAPEQCRHQQAEQRDRDQQLEQREAMLWRPQVAMTAHSDGSPVRSVIRTNCSAGLAPQATVTCTW